MAISLNSPDPPRALTITKSADNLEGITTTVTGPAIERSFVLNENVRRLRR